MRREENQTALGGTGSGSTGVTVHSSPVRQCGWRQFEILKKMNEWMSLYSHTTLFTNWMADIQNI